MEYQTMVLLEQQRVQADAEDTEWDTDKWEAAELEAAELGWEAGYYE
jgi:hypothetical protein